MREGVFYVSIIFVLKKLFLYAHMCANGIFILMLYT